MLAEKLEEEMYTKLFDALGGESMYSVYQFLDPIERVIRINLDFTSKDILDELNNTQIHYIDYFTAASLLEVSPTDFNSLIDVSYVDTDTAEDMIHYLNTIDTSKDPYLSHSVESIRNFIINNTMTREEIDKYCERLENQK